MILYPSHRNRHITESQCRQGATGSIFHPVKVGLTDNVCLIIKAAGLIINLFGTACVLIVERFTNQGEERKYFVMVADQIIPAIFAVDTI